MVKTFMKITTREKTIRCFRTMQSLKETKIPLGKGKLYITSPKAKFSIHGYCPYCNNTVKLSNEHKCLICGSRVTKKQNNDAVIEKFETALEQNKEALYAWIPTIKESNQPKINIKIRTFNYKIPFRYFLEFENLRGSDDENPHNHFFNHIKDSCPRDPLF